MCDDCVEPGQIRRSVGLQENACELPTDLRHWKLFFRLEGLPFGVKNNPGGSS